MKNSWKGGSKKAKTILMCFNYILSESIFIICDVKVIFRVKVKLWLITDN